MESLFINNITQIGLQEGKCFFYGFSFKVYEFKYYFYVNNKTSRVFSLVFVL